MDRQAGWPADVIYSILSELGPSNNSIPYRILLLHTVPDRPPSGGAVDHTTLVEAIMRELPYVRVIAPLLANLIPIQTSNTTSNALNAVFPGNTLTGTSHSTISTFTSRHPSSPFP